MCDGDIDEGHFVLDERAAREGYIEAPRRRSCERVWLTIGPPESGAGEGGNCTLKRMVPFLFCASPHTFQRVIAEDITYLIAGWA